jgi:hypothetical protein
MMAQILNTQHSKFIKLLESLDVPDLDLSLMFDTSIEQIKIFKNDEAFKDNTLYLRILEVLDIDVIDFFSKDTEELDYQNIVSRLFCIS